MWRYRSLLIIGAWFAAAAGADERILSFDADIDVHADGAMTVTETIRVQAEGNVIRRGLIREFPTRYRTARGDRVVVAFEPVEVQRNGRTEDWHTESRNNGVAVYFGSADRMLEHGVHEYRFRYRTNRQLGFFDSHQELWWNVTGDDWAFPIERATATVTLPAVVDANDWRLDSFTGPHGATGSTATATVVGPRSVRFETGQSLPPGHGLTIVAGWPVGIVATPTDGQRLRWFLADNGGVLALGIGALLIAAWFLTAWWRVGRDPRAGTIIPRFEPPAGLSPAATRFVQKMGLDQKAFSAALISLGVKGHLSIEDRDGDFALQRTEPKPGRRRDGVAPSAGEQAVLEALFGGHESRIEMAPEQHARFRSARSELTAALEQEFAQRLFRRNARYLIPGVLIAVAATALAVLQPPAAPWWLAWFVYNGVMLGLFAWLLRAPTIAGRAVLDEIEGFKMYLGTAERDRLDRMRAPTLTPEVFEAFLPYAHALGVANQWAQRFTNELPQAAADPNANGMHWYHGSARGLAAVHHIGSSGFGGQLGGAISSASSPPGSSSGTSGGGFSGGGGGGGGGGGW